MPFLLFQTADGPVACTGDRCFRPEPRDWDTLLNLPGLHDALAEQSGRMPATARPQQVLAPLGSQEIWAAGVTYYRSRDARIAESKSAGGSDFYDRVYDAPRPELFLKATPGRVVAPGGTLRLRRDSRWMVPEPELTLVINARHEIIGYTVGNDLSCRDIEGENPLYLPQAKIFDGCAAIGPALLIQHEPLPAVTAIELEVLRAGQVIVQDRTTLAALKRSPTELVEYLTRETRFPAGCYLMTGTGIVPDDAFSLAPGDEVRITIAPIGTLVNRVA